MKALGFRFVLCTLLLTCAWAQAQTESQEAGDTSVIDREDRGPLKEKIPPVSGHFFLRKGRFELTPSVGLSFKDAFFSKYILGGSFTYHATETVGVMLRGGYAVDTVSSAAQKCVFGTTGGPVCQPPSMDSVQGVAPGLIHALVELDAQWAPLYGKISIFGEKVIHFDIYGIAGPAAVLYGGPRPSDGSALDTPTWTVGGNVGVGTHLFINRWITLRAELQDVIYQENLATDLTGISQNHSLRNQLVFDVGLSFFFPMHVEEG